jgi:hypothetical protein
MHPDIHRELSRTIAADRAEHASRAALPKRRMHPPPVRGRVAYAAARLARRLDTEQARRAIA